VLRVAETNMSHAIHTMTVERGVDPRGFVLLAYGGGGGLFAAATAEELEIRRVIVPPAPAVFSAWGILSSDYREDASLTRIQPLAPTSVPAILGDLETLRRQVVADLAGYGFEPPGVEIRHRLELRFAGQEHSIAVPLDAAWLDDGDAFLIKCRRRFTGMHRQLYGHGDPEGPIEVVTARCRGIGAVERPRWPPWAVGKLGTPRSTRAVHFHGAGLLDTPVYDRDLLALDQVVVGPAIVEEWTTTILVPPTWRATVDRLGNLVLEGE